MPPMSRRRFSYSRSQTHLSNRAPCLLSIWKHMHLPLVLTPEPLILLLLQRNNYAPHLSPSEHTNHTYVNAPLQVSRDEVPYTYAEPANAYAPFQSNCHIPLPKYSHYPDASHVHWNSFSFLHRNVPVSNVKYRSLQWYFPISYRFHTHHEIPVFASFDLYSLKTR